MYNLNNHCIFTQSVPKQIERVPVTSVQATSWTAMHVSKLLHELCIDFPDWPEDNNIRLCQCRAKARFFVSWVAAVIFTVARTLCLREYNVSVFMLVC